jgi:hypothetical protein
MGCRRWLLEGRAIARHLFMPPKTRKQYNMGAGLKRVAAENAKVTRRDISILGAAFDVANSDVAKWFEEYNLTARRPVSIEVTYPREDRPETLSEAVVRRSKGMAVRPPAVQPTKEDV